MLTDRGGAQLKLFATNPFCGAKGSRMWKRLGILVLTAASTAACLIRPEGRARSVTILEAKRLVLLALTPEIAGLPGLSVDPYDMPDSPDFYFLEVRWQGRPGGSAVAGHFAVDKTTGDVWDAVAECTEISNSELRKVQLRLRASMGLTSSGYKAAKREGPLCQRSSPIATTSGVALGMGNWFALLTRLALMEQAMSNEVGGGTRRGAVQYCSTGGSTAAREKEERMSTNETRSMRPLSAVVLGLWMAAAARTAPAQSRPRTAGEPASSVRLLITWHVGTHDLVVRVDETTHDGWPERTLSFSSTRSGDSKPLYSMTTEDAFLTAFPTGESGGSLVTVWVGGSALHVLVFRYGEDRINKVLEAGSRSFPELVARADGGEQAIIVSEGHYDVTGTGSRWIDDFATVFTWDGKWYVPRRVAWAKRLAVLDAPGSATK